MTFLSGRGGERGEIKGEREGEREWEWEVGMGRGRTRGIGTESTDTNGLYNYVKRTVMCS